MEKGKLPFFKGTVKITKRKVPFWITPFQKLGFFRSFGKVISVNKYENVFCNVGKYSILDRMKGDNKGEITYLALGSNTTTPLATDTTLGTETFRKLITTRTRTGLIFYTSTFLATTEANGTHKEMGLFGDNATGTTDSGTLFTHLTINETKSSGETITIDYDIEAL